MRGGRVSPGLPRSRVLLRVAAEHRVTGLALQANNPALQTSVGESDTETRRVDIDRHPGI